jgi:putative membrane protein
MDLSVLPSLNAALNATSALLLVLGYTLIRQRAMTAHTICMLGACGTSALFLTSYIYYHFHHGHTVFPGHGLLKVFYLVILISHVILAVVIVPLVAITLTWAFRGNFLKHVRIARITLPLWLYVSVTGVIVYWMLYRVRYV